MSTKKLEPGQLSAMLNRMVKGKPLRPVDARAYGFPQLSDAAAALRGAGLEFEQVAVNYSVPRARDTFQPELRLTPAARERAAELLGGAT